MIRVTLDDREITVPEGTMVVDAATELGIDVSIYAYHQACGRPHAGGQGHGLTARAGPTDEDLLGPVGPCVDEEFCIGTGMGPFDNESGEMMVKDALPEVQPVPRPMRAETKDGALRVVGTALVVEGGMPSAILHSRIPRYTVRGTHLTIWPRSWQRRISLNKVFVSPITLLKNENFDPRAVYPGRTRVVWALAHQGGARKLQGGQGTISVMDEARFSRRLGVALQSDWQPAPPTWRRCRGSSRALGGGLAAMILAIVVLVVKILRWVVLLMGGFAYTMLLARRRLGFFPLRLRPNRVGPGGMLHPMADALKMMRREDMMPFGADSYVCRLAPVIAGFAALSVDAVIPLGAPIHLFGLSISLDIAKTPALGFCWSSP